MASLKTPLILPQDINLDRSIIVDARSGPEAFKRYDEKHLKGALHADLDRDLSAKPMDPSLGGRHPLPDIKDFTAFVGGLGINPSSHVVIYDDKNGANAAARLWWMLRAISHENVQVVDGGLDAIIRSNLPLSSGMEHPKSASPYPADKWQLPTVSLDDVVRASTSGNKLIIDVRESYRYRGESEPIDLVAGHIPGAVNVPYVENLSPTGSFRSVQELAERYRAVIGNRQTSDVIVHCGSGVTACHTLLALEHAGIKGANLYVGSWGEWSRRELPIASGDH